MHRVCVVLAVAAALGACASREEPRLRSVPLPVFKGDFRVVSPAPRDASPPVDACPERIERVTDGAVFVLEHRLVQDDPAVRPRPLGDYRPEKPSEGGLGAGEWVRVDCESLVSLAVLQVR